MQYHDEEGKHYCAADIVFPELRLVVECKRTWTEKAEAQLQLLYMPLLARLWPGLWSGVVVCKFWNGPAKPLLKDLLKAPPGVSHYIWR